MGQHASMTDREADRLLVGGARVWLGVSGYDLSSADRESSVRPISSESNRSAQSDAPRLCSNHGRPNLLENDPSLRLGRRFLLHPLTTKEDSRCVVLCEAQAIKGPIHRARAMTNRPPEQTLQGIVEEAAQKLNDWEDYWSLYYCRYRLNSPRGKVLRKIIAQSGVRDDDFLVTERECNNGMHDS